MSATSKAEAAPKPVRPSYLLAFLGTLLGMFALYYGVLLTLSTTGNLPPPAFSNSLCIDEKLHHLRLSQPTEPTLLVVGSSVAWRHFDGETLVRRSPGAMPLNGGFCGLSVNQTAFTADWLLDRYNHVQDVVMIASPQDFTDCTDKPSAIFSREDAEDYVFGGASPWFYYTRYFSLVSLARNAISIADKRSGANRIDPLVFDRFGSGPLGADSTRGALLYGRVGQPDPACFEALAAMSRNLQAEGRRLMVAITPLHPDWRAGFDHDGLLLRNLGDGIRGALQGTGARFWDSNQTLALDASAFFDAIHLRWQAVPRFTAALLQAFDLAGRPASRIHDRVW